MKRIKGLNEVVEALDGTPLYMNPEAEKEKKLLTVKTVILNLLGQARPQWNKEMSVTGQGELNIVVADLGLSFKKAGDSINITEQEEGILKTIVVENKAGSAGYPAFITGIVLKKIKQAEAFKGDKE